MKKPMTGNSGYHTPVYDFRTKDTHIPETYSAGSPRRGKAAKRGSPTGLSPILAAAGCILTAVMLCAGLLIQARLTDLSQQTVDVMERIELLENEKARLEIAHAAAFAPAELEARALELGMRRPCADQIINADPSGSDFDSGDE